MKIRQLLLLLSAVLVLLPAISIGVWTHTQSVKDGFREVPERHLLLAKNISGALEKYYSNTKLVFGHISGNLARGLSSQDVHMDNVGKEFISISLVEGKSGKIINSDSYNQFQLATDPLYRDQGVLEIARRYAGRGSVTFSPVVADVDGTNVIVVAKWIGENIAIGKLKTDHIVNLGKSIAFGQRGHAAIVDDKGNVLSHPLDSWIKSRKNIAELAPVMKMLNGQSGIQQFYSPALDANIIAGFSSVKGPGWGVMVPQPVAELYASANQSSKSYLVIVIASFAVAMLLTIWVSMRSTRPLHKLIAANKNMDNPDKQKVLKLPKSWVVPSEIKQLYRTHNEMAARLHSKHADILRMAYSDLVTGLPTREAFIKLVENEFAKSRPHDDSYLLIFLDLDEFKLINDTLGHETGDTVLSIVSKQIADSITSYTHLDVITCPLDEFENPIKTLEGRAVISRIGGDEFVALIPWNRGVREVDNFLQSLNSSISSPYLLGDKEFSTSTSIGASMYGRDGRTIRELTKKADVAMYWAKKSGKNCYRLFDSTVSAKSPLELQQEVADAIINDEMKLFYQPKINAITGDADSVEAVVRWIHPQRGIVSPALFIPVIDNTEVADLLGEWVIRTACQQIKVWENAGKNITASVNIANRHLVSQNFVPDLLKIVEEENIRPECLEIEMTEETAMTNHKRAKFAIKALKENGFAVSLDDYGKGYSNLARLAALDIDVIKLDLSLINGITEDPRRAIIVASALDMARNLNCKTVVEGIETREQANFVSKMGCDYLQGFLFAKPMPVDELNIWLLKRAADKLTQLGHERTQNPLRMVG